MEEEVKGCTFLSDRGGISGIHLCRGNNNDGVSEYRDIGISEYRVGAEGAHIIGVSAEEHIAGHACGQSHFCRERESGFEESGKSFCRKAAANGGGGGREVIRRTTTFDISTTTKWTRH